MPILKNMKHDFSTIWLSTFALVLLMGQGSVWADRLPLEGLTTGMPASSPAQAQEEDGPDFLAGVKAYREGNYRQADRIFSTLHKQAPENTRYTYYLAITQGQLGRFQQCKALYEEIITLEPNGKAASLARQGLSYLPKANELDMPPRFNAAATAPEKTEPAPAQKPVAAQQPGQFPTREMADSMKQSMQQGMSPQDMMMMQMMMGQQNGMGGMGGGTNPMSWMMMPGMMGNQGGNSGFDPSIMSNMMMNQMMQGFNMGGDSNGNP